MGTLKTEIGHYSMQTIHPKDRRADFAQPMAKPPPTWTLRLEGSLPGSLKFDPETKLGEKLTEKPIFQDPEIGIHLASTGSNYFVVEEDLVLPTVICGLGQGNRLSVVKETNITRCKRLGQVASFSLLASRVCLEKVQFECDYGVLI
jgi:hypothetical protein